MSRSGASGGPLDEFAAFALAHAGAASAEDAGVGAVFLFADDVEDRYLYTFADLDEAHEHLADPTHGYLRCAVAWRPGPDVLTVHAQEIGDGASFTLTRTEGSPPLLPGSGPVGRAKAEPGDPADLADLEDAFQRAVDSGEGLTEAEDRVRGWVERADEDDWAAAEKWLRGRLPAAEEHDPAALPDGPPGGVRTAGRYVIAFDEDDAPTGSVAALATWDRIARQAREIVGPTAGPAEGTAVGHPVSGVRLALDRASGRYELSAPLPGEDTVPTAEVLEQLYRLAFAVQLETGRRAVDPQAGRYVDQLGGATWGRRFGLFVRAVHAFRPGRL
ncbi:hypothetical protein [Streptomyces sp. Isolate_45]|uniref:hypothetical protein n=1 Tax=Streptomyces sp. Isolate_45 TaxID=2950111 RepID=UPI002481A112|nr:hypothetical protein [Streptomyces sp. Isolate_45]MDA5279162.1 hypothetical protein [Streptomyces sp. Isolate_45]